MRKLFAVLACSVLSYFSSLAQQCSPVTTTAPAGITLGYNSGGYQIFENNSINVDISSDYIFTTPQSLLYFSYDLASSSNANPQVNSYTIDVIYRNSSGSFYKTCSGTSAFTVNSSVPVRHYFSADVSGLPVNTRFFIRLTLNVSNVTNANIIGSSFRLQNTATLLPVESTLPVNFLSIEAKRQGASNLITWKVAAEENVANYELERSADGRNFTKIGSVQATKASAYSLTDNQVAATVYYRVKNNDKDGRFKYSSILKVENGKISFLKRVYPVPAANEVDIQHETANTSATINIFTQDGRLVKKNAVRQGSMQTKINVTNLSSGLYIVKYDDGQGNTDILKLVKE
jgi:hypothetical protein